MNVWKLTGAGKLEKTESAIPEPVAGKIKVRVTKVLIGNSDAETYLGSSRIVHPLIPGQFAIGMIAEETENPLNALSVREHVAHYMRKGFDKKEAIKAVCRDRGTSKNEVYQEVLDFRE